MPSKQLYIALSLWVLTTSGSVLAEESLSLFGSKPIQLSIDKDGLKPRKEIGVICELEASLGGAKYSEWGETEDDARSLVVKKCTDQSGLLLCKKDKATCKKDK